MFKKFVYLIHSSRSSRHHPITMGKFIKYNIKLKINIFTSNVRTKIKEVENVVLHWDAICKTDPVRYTIIIPATWGLEKNTWTFIFFFYSSSLPSLLPFCCPEEQLGYQLFFDYLTRRQILFIIEITGNLT